ncbi:MAG: hypothetical protein ACRDRK_18810 [Pseudonocardia sp.]
MASGPAGIVAVLSDEAMWSARGILIAMVETGDTDGVRVGVHTDPHAAQVTLGPYYPFPVVCYQWPGNWPDNWLSGAAGPGPP